MFFFKFVFRVSGGDAYCASCHPQFPFKSWLSVSDMASGVERFELLLVNEHKVAAEVFHSLKHMGCESVADFVGLYTEADYEDGLKEVLQKTETFKDNRIQLARLRVAWARAKQDLSATSSGPQEENLEAPLPPEVRQRQEDAFFAKYNVRFPPDLLPAATLFARHFRELRRQHKELDDLARVKSAAESSTAPATEVKQLGDFRVVLKAEPPAVSFKDLISLLRAHEILLNSWAMAGTAERDSKLLPGTKVLEFSMSDNLAYRTFAAERLRRYPGTVTQAIQWFLDRDRQTRLAAITLYQDEWPLGEALKTAYEPKTAVLWQVGGSGVGAVDDALSSKPPEPPAPKRLRVDRAGSSQVDTSTGKTISAKDLCEKWNKGQCTRRQAECSEKKLHRCSFPVEGGFCGAWQHHALNHNKKSRG